MQKDNKYLIVVFAILMSLCSCSTDGFTDESLTDGPEEMITISLNPGGNNASRASTNDVYGINIFYDKDKDGVCEAHYGYGLFNDKDAMTVTLISSYRYKFVCSMVKNATNVLYCGSGNLMAYPFQTNGSTTKYVENKFNYGESEYLTGLASGYSRLTSGENTSKPHTDRYYGEKDGYTPKSGERVTIEMKRTVYGVKYVITGVVGGQVNVSCDDYNKTTRIDCESEELIYTYEDVYACWLNEPNVPATVNMTYTSDRGEVWSYSKSQSIEFKRNVMTTVYVSVDPDLSNTTLNIVEEEFDDNIINIGLDTNGLIDILVDPTQEQ